MEKRSSLCKPYFKLSREISIRLFFGILISVLVQDRSCKYCICLDKSHFSTMKHVNRSVYFIIKMCMLTHMW